MNRALPDAKITYGWLFFVNLILLLDESLRLPAVYGLRCLRTVLLLRTLLRARAVRFELFLRLLDLAL